jgi:hypothetical protein
MKGYNDAYSNDGNNPNFGEEADGCFDEDYGDGRDNPLIQTNMINVEVVQVAL